MKSYPQIVDYHPDRKIKFNINNQFGWGFKDTYFIVDEKRENIMLTGNRYDYCQKLMPHYGDYAVSITGINPKTAEPLVTNEKVELPLPNFNHEFLAELGEYGFSRRSFDKMERLMHSHGESTAEMVLKRFLSLKKFVDVVIYPETEA